MTKFSVKRMLAAVGVCVAILAGTMFHADHAAGQGGDQGMQGTWTVSQPDSAGGTLYTWFTFGTDGSYKMTSANRGGGYDGNVIQRWGTYQARPVGQGQYQTTLRITGGAPSQVCVQGAQCNPVPGIQSTSTMVFAMRNGTLSQGNATFQRGQLPAQLQQVASTKYLAAPAVQAATTPTVHPYVTPGTHPYTTPGGGANHDATGGIKGLNGNCDNAQQANICHYGNGGYYHQDHNTGCMVCEKY